MRVSRVSRSAVVVGVLLLLACGCSSGMADSWSVVPSPNGNPYINTLDAVTCTSSSNCWAVGGGQDPLTEHWDGSNWAEVTAPAPARDDSTLNSVACATASLCWAAGSDYYSTLPFLEMWNGNSWTSVNPAAPPDGQGEFLGVTCVSGDDCWAVGDQDENGFQTPLIEFWDGTTWYDAASPEPYGVLSGVSCVSAKRCWAVGSDVNAVNGKTEPLIETLKGTTWKAKVLPLAGSKTGGVFNAFNSISCVSSGDCWAVGYNQVLHMPGADGVRPDTDYDSYSGIIEHWNGSKWSSAAGTGIANGAPADVACPSESNCTTVGATEIFGTTNSPLIEVGPTDGWSQVPTGVPFTTGGNLYGDWCSETGCWAVGTNYDQGATLIDEEGTP
jgi:hypothetical protein